MEGGAEEEILHYEEMGRDLVSKLKFLAVQKPCIHTGHF